MACIITPEKIEYMKNYLKNTRSTRSMMSLKVILCLTETPHLLSWLRADITTF